MNQADFPVRALCRVLKVSPSAFYAWRGLPPSAPAMDGAVLTEWIRQIHAASDGNHGYSNIHTVVRDEGPRVGGMRVALLTRPAQIVGVNHRRGFIVMTQRDPSHWKASDLVNWTFHADGANQLWVAGITYVLTWAGFAFLVIVLHVWGRSLVGLVMNQDSQCTSVTLGERCEKLGVPPSMDSVGDAYDNAMTERFLASLECELFDCRSFETKSEAQLALLRYSQDRGN